MTNQVKYAFQLVRVDNDDVGRYLSDCEVLETVPADTAVIRVFEREDEDTPYEVCVVENMLEAGRAVFTLETTKPLTCYKDAVRLARSFKTIRSLGFVVPYVSP